MGNGNNFKMFGRLGGDAEFSGNWLRRATTQSFHDLPDTTANGCRDASQGVLLDFGSAERSRVGEGQDRGDGCPTREANAAMRSIVRRDSGESYEEFLKGLAKKSGIATPTREDLAQLDRKRKNKASNKDWVNPHERDARITKMKDGRTHLAHKAEHAVDLESGAVLAVTLQEAHQGDTTTVVESLAQAGENAAELLESETTKGKPQMHVRGIEEVVADKGYHSGAVLVNMQGAAVRTY